MREMKVYKNVESEHLKGTDLWGSSTTKTNPKQAVSENVECIKMSRNKAKLVALVEAIVKNR
jgi:hypothetical protein